MLEKYIFAVKAPHMQRCSLLGFFLGRLPAFVEIYSRFVQNCTKYVFGVNLDLDCSKKIHKTFSVLHNSVTSGRKMRFMKDWFISEARARIVQTGLYSSHLFLIYHFFRRIRTGQNQLLISKVFELYQTMDYHFRLYFFSNIMFSSQSYCVVTVI